MSRAPFSHLLLIIIMSLSHMPCRRRKSNEVSNINPSIPSPSFCKNIQPYALSHHTSIQVSTNQTNTQYARQTFEILPFYHTHTIHKQIGTHLQYTYSSKNIITKLTYIHTSTTISGTTPSHVNNHKASQ